MPRHFGNWLTEYIKWVERSEESPRNYHWWSGVTAISAAMRRHVFVDRGTRKILPNLFTILVGRPGIGKGGAVNPAIDLLKKSNSANILSDRITIEFVLEKLAKGFTVPSVTGTGVTFSTSEASALIFSPELSIFITASLATLPILADLWDAREGKFDYGTRSRGEFKIDSPCISLLAGSTSEWLVSAIPSNAVGGGFTRRVNFVFARDRQQAIPWPLPSGATDFLVDDLRDIGALRGSFQFETEAKSLFENYHRVSGIIDEFDDEAVTAYKTSRWVQATKVAMCLSAARGTSLKISKADLEEAINAVDKCAVDLGLVFRSVGESDLAAAADRVLRFVEFKGYATRSDILAANWRHISSSDLDVVISTLTQGNMIVEMHQGGKVIYKAVPPKPQPQKKKGAVI